MIKEMLRLTSGILEKTLEKDADKRGAPESPWKRSANLKQLGVNYRWSSVVQDERAAANADADAPAAGAYGSDAAGRLHAGDRAPDAPALVDVGSATVSRLFGVFNVTRHTALVFASGPDVSGVLSALGQYPKGTIHTIVVYPQSATATPAQEGADSVVKDSEGHAYSAYGIAADQGTVSVAIVRPDGVVGGLVSGEEGVKKYFSGVLTST